MDVWEDCQFEGCAETAAEVFEVASLRRPPREYELCREHAEFVRRALEPQNKGRVEVWVKQRDGRWEVSVEERLGASLS